MKLYPAIKVIEFSKDNIETYRVLNGKTVYEERFYKKTKRHKKNILEVISETCVCKNYCRHLNKRYKFSKFAVGYETRGA